MAQMAACAKRTGRRSAAFLDGRRERPNHPAPTGGTTMTDARQSALLAILRRAPVVPVLTIEDPHTAVPLAQALVAGGLPALEITLRTDGALDAMEAIARHVPDAIVGAGTVLSASQVKEATSAGARFLVSPGCTEALSAAAAQGSAPLL